MNMLKMSPILVNTGAGMTIKNFCLNRYIKMCSNRSVDKKFYWLYSKSLWCEFNADLNINLYCTYIRKRYRSPLIFKAACRMKKG